MKIDTITVLAKLDNGKVHEVLINKQTETAIINVLAAMHTPIQMNEESLDSIEITTRS